MNLDVRRPGAPAGEDCRKSGGDDDMPKEVNQVLMFIMPMRSAAHPSRRKPTRAVRAVR